uniref:Uncharacterized protein n=1 Tax=Lepeophtheirus salmonis TaxID=72036 RepID=A0A0K2VCW7_LEPSM
MSVFSLITFSEENTLMTILPFDSTLKTSKHISSGDVSSDAVND